MSNIPDELRYATSHEWIRIEDDGTANVGISDHAQDALGDIVFVELPEPGTSVNAKDEVAVPFRFAWQGCDAPAAAVYQHYSLPEAVPVNLFFLTF